MTPTVTVPRRTFSERSRAGGGRGASPRLHRRVSGPVSGRGLPGVAHAPRESVALSGRALALVRGLPDHSLIDRLVRGRAWIPVLGVLLAGIVAMQVEILKLGTTMGRALEHSATLQTQNESLQASVASLADDQRIERLAAAMGMTMPSPTSLVFLKTQPGGAVGRAVANLHAPDPAGFASQLAAQAAAAAALMPAAPASTSPAAPGATPGTSAATGSPAVTSAAIASTGSSAAPAPAPALSTTAAPAASTSGGSVGASTTTGGGSGQSTTTGAAAIAPAGSANSTGGG